MAISRRGNGGLLAHESNASSAYYPQEYIEETIREIIDEKMLKIDFSKYVLHENEWMSTKTGSHVRQTGVASYKMIDLGDTEYELKMDISIVLEIYDDEVIAVFPDLELFGQGSNMFEAIKDLQGQILDLYEEYQNTANNKLGKDPLRWKKILKKLVKKLK